MADIKITDLAAYSDPVSTDVLPIVDVGNDLTKKVSIADLLENAGTGTASAPSFSFDGDNNTGIYRPAADQVAVSAGGTQALLIESSGVTVPGNLTVQGTTTTIDTTTLVVEDKNIELGSVSTPTDTTADGGGITLKGASDKTINWVQSTGCWTFNQPTNFNDDVRIDSAGRLLVGITSAANADSSSLVQSVHSSGGQFIAARSDTSVGTGNSIGGMRFFGNDSDGNYDECARIECVADGEHGDDDKPSRLVFSTTADDASSPTERMRIANDGLTTVAGGVQITGEATPTSGKGVEIFRVSDTLSQIQTYNRDGSAWMDLIIKGKTQQFYANGSEAMHLNSSGQFGIGTTSPSETLTLNTSTGASIGFEYGGTEIATISNNNSALYVHAGSEKLLSLGADGEEKMRITSGGNVGIGTSSPAQKLHIVASSGVNNCVRAELSGTASYETNAGHFVNTDNGTGSARGIYVSGTDFGVYSNSGTNYFGGSVGINTTSPAGTFGVDGAAFFGNQSSSGSTDGVLRIVESTSSVYLQTGTNTSAGSSANLVFSNINASNEWMRIDSSGRVGIGTTSPGSFNDSAENLVIQSSGDTGLTIAATSSTSSSIHFADGSSGDASYRGIVEYKHGDDALVFYSSATERMRITSDGNVLIGKSTTAFSTAGTQLYPTGEVNFVRDGSIPVYIRRNTNDGTLIAFFQDGSQEGTISVSGTTVSYNGAHLSRWSQLASGAERTEILRGSVLSNLDEMCEWGDEDNEQLNRMQVSNVEGDRNVAGVFQAWDDDDDTYINDFYCAMTGDFVIRIAQGTTVARGDLLMSAGDGTAKPQDDDIVRSKTIAKVTSTTVSATYADGSYCVPCVLMAC